MANPVLIELTRSRLVESVHTGALAVVRHSGEVVLALGDVRRPVYPRSAVKAFQCVPVLETGTADRFDFGPAEIALACASHSGSPRHAALASDMLARAGLGAGLLACGAHEPLGPDAARDLLRSGTAPSALHNNCSGKHAAMLATAIHRGEEPTTYWQPQHPVQQRVRQVLEAFTGLSLGAAEPGIDGCSAPNWAIPLANLAQAFARLGAREAAEPARRAALGRILEACWAEPDLVAGDGRLDTILLRRFQGELFLKTGAEGVYCGVVPGCALGFALKIDDGAKRASELAVEALIARLLPRASDLPSETVLRNWSGREVGTMRCAAAYLAALDSIPPA
jgi:L-asparaginase II